VKSGKSEEPNEKLSMLQETGTGENFTTAKDVGGWGKNFSFGLASTWLGGGGRHLQHRHKEGITRGGHGGRIQVDMIERCHTR